MVKRKGPMTDLKKEYTSQAELRQLIRIDDLKMEPYHFKPASCVEDYFTALKLVQEVYIKEGYVNAAESACRYRILKNHFLEETAVFIGKNDQELVFTVSLFPDSTHGLPMDRIYKIDLDHLRIQGRRIGEVGCLATHPGFRNGSQNILMHGNKIMLKYAMEYLHLDDLVITVHPKHALVYKEALMFEEIGQGEIKAYPKVNNNPAIALRLNLHDAKEKFRRFYQDNSPETNLHHFLFVKQSNNLQLPENNKTMCNHFYNFFAPPFHTDYPAYHS